MFCKESETTINTLLNLKGDEDKPTINLIGSYQDSIPGIKIGHSISSVQSQTKGELREFIGLLKGLTH